MQEMPNILSLFRNEFDQFNNTISSIYQFVLVSCYLSLFFCFLVIYSSFLAFLPSTFLFLLSCYLPIFSVKCPPFSFSMAHWNVMIFISMHLKERWLPQLVEVIIAILLHFLNVLSRKSNTWSKSATASPGKDSSLARYVRLTHLSPMNFPFLINWNSPFLF